MALELSVIKNLGNQNVLVLEKDKRNREHLYVVPENKADAFIKSRKNAKVSDGFQKFCSVSLAGMAGIYTGITLKLPTYGKVAAGIATAAATIFACSKFDKWADNFIKKQDLKSNNVREITDLDSVG